MNIELLIWELELKAKLNLLRAINEVQEGEDV